MTEPDREKAREMLAVAGIDRHADAESAIAAALASERARACDCSRPHWRREEEAVEPADFLLARIAEDEAVARYNQQQQRNFHWSTPWDTFNPARVLAECEAKRRIVELHAVSVTSPWVNPPGGPAYQEPERTCAICGWVPDACDTVKAFTFAYAGHPDYREEWASVTT